MTAHGGGRSIALENRRLVLARRPRGMVRDGNFELRRSPASVPGPGEILVRVCWLSFDPAQRGWLDEGPSYIPAVAIGETMRATGVGQVIASRNEAFPVGALVSGTFGWQELALSDGGGEIVPVELVPEGVSPTAALGVLGTTGMTAYFGMLEVGRPRQGETVVVSGAAGATGSVAGQLAKLRGATVIGIAGGPEKCRWLTEAAGFDAAIDYKNEAVEERLRRLAPAGIDVYYDNVGGSTLDAALAALAHGARVVCCGAISSRFATAAGPPPGIHNLSALIVKSARMQGFILLDYASRFREAKRELGAWLRDGSLIDAEDLRQGSLEDAPATLRRLFEGANLGKQLLQLAEPEAAADHLAS